jgi:hypothetical protein
VTPEERRLLEATARSVLKIREDILDRMTGVEMVLHAIFLAKGNTDIALARLRVLADLLARKGTPSPYLGSFLAGCQDTGRTRDRTRYEGPSIDGH